MRSASQWLAAQLSAALIRRLIAASETRLNAANLVRWDGGGIAYLWSFTGRNSATLIADSRPSATGRLRRVRGQLTPAGRLRWAGGMGRPFRLRASLDPEIKLHPESTPTTVSILSLTQSRRMSPHAVADFDNGVNSGRRSGNPTD